MPTPNVLCEFVSAYKKSGYFTVLGIWLIKRSCKLIEWEHFSPYLKNKILCMNTADDIHFHDSWPNFPINWKNPVFGSFWAHFPNFGSKKKFPRKSGSVMHNFTWDSSTMPKFRKKKQWHNSKKTPGQMEGWKDRRKDGQTLFYRTLLATQLGVQWVWM